MDLQVWGGDANLMCLCDMTPQNSNWEGDL